MTSDHILPGSSFKSLKDGLKSVKAPPKLEIDLEMRFFTSFRSLLWSQSSLRLHEE